VEGEVVLEIGAGHGVEACLAAVAGAKKVIAIEADGQRSDYIRENAEQNGVADRVEVRTLKIGDGIGESVRLDDLDVEPSVLRMDIEGAEWDALASGPDLLSKVGLVFIEVHPDKAPSEKDISDIKKILSSANLAPVSRSARSQPFVHAHS
jgi:tRNA A58 N-methylase Trm61